MCIQHMAAHIETKEEKKTPAKKLPSVDFSNGLYCVFTSWCSQKPTWNPDKMKYLVFQREQCPETKKKHWQGYVEMKSSTRHLALKKMLEITDPEEDAETGIKGPGGWKALIRRGSAIQAAQYCKKIETRINPETLPTEYGEKPVKTSQGHRSDLEAPALMIREGKSIEEIADACPIAYMRYTNGITAYHQIHNKFVEPDPGITLRPWQEAVCQLIDLGFKKRQILWIWSQKSGTGKSTMRDYIQFKYGNIRAMDGVWNMTELLYLYKKHDIIVFDLPRKTPLNDSRQAILENLSDGGTRTSTKYQTVQKLLRAVIIVFANIPPPEADMPMRCEEIWIDSDEDKAEYEKNREKPEED
nr:putative replication associated protein [Crucivirus sp.]